MRILIPILGFGPMGGFRVLTQLANTWIAGGHEVVFLVPETSSAPYHVPNARTIYVNSNGRERKHVTSPESRRAASGFDNARSLRNAFRYVEKQFDVILCDNSIAIISAALGGVSREKVFYYNQSDEVLTQSFLRSPVKHMMARASLMWGCRIISNSPNYPMSGVEIIYPGVDCEIFHNNRKAPLSNDEIVLGTVGRKEPYKGTIDVLDAARKLHQRGLRFKLRVALGNVPSGSDESYIEVVEINNDYQLSDFYRSLDVLLVGCKGQHGAPHYPLIEAMACGTPVVHTDYYPGTDENSWIAAPSNPQSIADKVLDLINDSGMKDKVNIARRFVEENLSWNKVSSKFIEAFQENKQC